MEKLPAHLQLTPSQNLFSARGPKFQFKFHYETNVSGFDVLTHIWLWMYVWQGISNGKLSIMMLVQCGRRTCTSMSKATPTLRDVKRDLIKDKSHICQWQPKAAAEGKQSHGLTRQHSTHTPHTHTLPPPHTHILTHINRNPCLVFHHVKLF